MNSQLKWRKWAGSYMMTSFKDRGVVTLLLVVFILVVTFLVYNTVVKPKETGMLTSVEIIKDDNAQQIEIYKKYHTRYAFKIQEDSKAYLRFYSYENNILIESKLEVTDEQFHKLVEGNKYWIEVKYSKKIDTSNGILEAIYTEEPMRR